MPAYFRSSINAFLSTKDDAVLSKLQSAYAADGYRTQYTSQTIAWEATLPALRRELSSLVSAHPAASTWCLLLEFPLYRLRRRIDAVVLTPETIAVIEFKTKASQFDSSDKRQVEEYAQDLRDFHAGSKEKRICPILWALDAGSPPLIAMESDQTAGVTRLVLVGSEGFSNCLAMAAGTTGFDSEQQSTAFSATWDEASYRPVPSVVDAAVAIFAGHGVREIATATAKNLNEATAAILSVIANARLNNHHAVVFLTGVPGAGKTLAGLNVVHSAVQSGVEVEGDIVYLSGNTPLVTVLREALALDQASRSQRLVAPITLKDARARTRATVQHINDFLKEYVVGDRRAPTEHVIVFDEAQRAWNAKQGKEKFGREASEPLLVLETMARHTNWSVCVCLIGIGQEINDGEEGIAGWADAIARVSAGQPEERWEVHGAANVFGASRSSDTLGPLPNNIRRQQSNSLHLEVPMRSFRSPALGQWIDHVVQAEFAFAKHTAQGLSYPVVLTRDLNRARRWLREMARGERRVGLLASSGAKRLRADGLGQILSATEGQAIAHWYLQPPGDIRSSFALEVPANEYTSQGLELDFACLCWGGDFIYSSEWRARTLSGNRWSRVKDPTKRSFIVNSYRVLLSRAREGIAIWVPHGDAEDHTRSPQEFDATASALIAAGAQSID